MKNHVQSAKTFRGFWLVLCEAYDLMLDNENHWSSMQLLGRGDRFFSAQPRRFHTEAEAQTEKDRILDGPPIEADSIFPDTTDGCWTLDDRQWLADRLKYELRGGLLRCRPELTCFGRFGTGAGRAISGLATFQPDLLTLRLSVLGRGRIPAARQKGF
jgi:hypothetical protein